ncbi:unnamed protein product [Gadus morhua 'NCC']
MVIEWVLGGGVAGVCLDLIPSGTPLPRRRTPQPCRLCIDTCACFVHYACEVNRTDLPGALSPLGSHSCICEVESSEWVGMCSCRSACRQRNSGR